MADAAELPEHVRTNRESWDGWAPEYVAHGELAWRQTPGDETWGIWDLPERELRFLPDDLEGKDTIELGCGTGYVSAWLARRGARPVGIDNSARQLETARRLQAEHGIEFPLIHGNAEEIPFGDGSFDLVMSEYGASIWADPQRWVPEAARVLRPGGRLIFLVNGLLLVLAMPEDERPATNELLRPQRGLGRNQWTEADGSVSVDFHLSHGDWIDLLRTNGLEVERLAELYPPEGATTDFRYVTPDWARQWPTEEVWIARKP